MENSDGILEASHLRRYGGIKNTRLYDVLQYETGTIASNFNILFGPQGELSSHGDIILTSF